MQHLASIQEPFPVGEIVSFGPTPTADKPYREMSWLFYKFELPDARIFKYTYWTDEETTDVAVAKFKEYLKGVETE